jgi:hypothetical protein
VGKTGHHSSIMLQLDSILMLYPKAPYSSQNAAKNIITED